MDLRIARADVAQRFAFAEEFRRSSSFDESLARADGSLTRERASAARAARANGRGIPIVSSFIAKRKGDGDDGDDDEGERKNDERRGEGERRDRGRTRDGGGEEWRNEWFAAPRAADEGAKRRTSASESESESESSDCDTFDLGVASDGTRKSAGSRASGNVREEDVLERWVAKKADVHARHSGRGTIQVSMAFEIISTKGKGTAGVEARLAELENTTAGQNAETHRISQQEYVTRLHRLNEDIANAWLNEDRVNSLKLCVKVAKLLGETNSGKFYPVLFVLVTEVIETVGRLVYDRILRKAEEDPKNSAAKALPVNFKASTDVRMSARNTCKNWFFKIATIREIVPRMYMELALFKCYRFLQDEPPTAQLERLMKMTRGIADPMAAAYMRMYIAKCAMAYGCETPDCKYTLRILEEFMPTYVGVLDESKDMDNNPSMAYVFRLGLRREEYSSLMDPAMEWLIQCCASTSSPTILQKVLYMGGETPPLPFLRAVFRSLSASVVHANAVKLTSLVGAKASDDDSFETRSEMADCYRVLGEKFDIKPPNESDRLDILREVWRVVQKWTHIEPYCRAADQFLRYIIKYLGQNELDTLMKDVARHVNSWMLKQKESDTATKHVDLTSDAMQHIESMLAVITKHYNDVSYLISLKWYIYLAEVLHGESKTRFSTALLECVFAGGEITDPLCLHHTLEAARTVHDSIHGMSTNDERNTAERLVVTFINNVSFGLDYEAHLNFLVTARSAFSNLALTQEVLVLHAISLILNVFERVKAAEHTKKTKAFVNACTAYCQITIPSVSGVKVRLELFTMTAEAALLHGLVQQVDGLIRSAITDAQESNGESAVGGWSELMPNEAEEAMFDFAKRCGSLLIVTPGNLEQGAFLLFRGLIKVIQEFEWQQFSARRIRSYIVLAPMVTAMAQPSLPYKIKGLQSNDVLFANEAAYIEEATELVHELVQTATDLAGDDPLSGSGAVEREESGTEVAVTLARVNLELARCIAMMCKPSNEMLALARGVVDRARRYIPSTEIDDTLEYVNALLAL